MSNTTFSGPVRSQNGFQTVLIDPTTGTVSTTSSLGADSSVTSVTVSDFLKLTPILTSALPLAAAGNAGQVRLISDNGAGNNEYCLVISTGAAWVTAVGAALT
jgi:hypothetical protein